MFAAYLKKTIRRFSRNKLLTLINILGLSLGIGTSILIFSYVIFQKSFDEFHKNSGRLYRIALEIRKQNGQIEHSAQNYPALGPALKNNFTGIQDYTRMYLATGGANTCTISYNDNSDPVVFNQTDVYYADASFLDMFTFPLKSGDKLSALKNPYSIVLTHEQALKYFGHEEAIGKTLTVDIDGGRNQFTVTGVLKDLPENTHFNFDFLLSYSSLSDPDFQNAWDWNEFYTYVLLTPGTKLKTIQDKLSGFINKYIGEKDKKYGLYESFIFQPVNKIHLGSHLAEEMKRNGSQSTVNILMVAAVAILLFALINYLNLSFGISINRLKEVGIRKILGADRTGIIRQLTGENFLLVTLALLLSLGLLFVFKNKLSTLTDLPAVIVSPGNRELIFTLIIIVGITYLVASVPAFLISSYKPGLSAKKESVLVMGGLSIRKSLLIIQFAISVILIGSAISIQKQIKLLIIQNPGADIHNVLVIHAPNYSYDDTTYFKTYQEFKNSIERSSAISDITPSSSIPGMENNWSMTGVIRRQGVDRHEAGTYYFAESDNNYIDFFKFSMVTGRNFSNDYKSSSSDIIINETASKTLGFDDPTDAIGQKIIMAQYGDRKEYSTVVGVIKDFHQEYGRKKILPLIFWTHPGINLYYCIKFTNRESLKSSIGLIKSQWKRFYPGNYFDSFYLDDYYNKQFTSELSFKHSITVFTYEALIIACLGILGISVISTTKRLKEIGVRKVLGATSGNIIQLLCSDYLKLILISNIIGLPVGYWLINKWLLNYAYRIHPGWWFYILPGVIISFSTLIIISYQIIVSVRTNPARILQYE